MAYGMNFKITSSGAYPNMKVKSIKVFSSICIACGIASIFLQFATMMMIGMGREIYIITSDAVGCGIWSGAIYLIVGGLGMAVTKAKRKRLLIAVVVLSSLSILASTVAFVLSGIVSPVGYYSCSYRLGDALCSVWRGLQFTIGACSILACISSIALVILASESLCTCCRKHEMRDPFPYVEATNVGERTADRQQQFDL